MPRFQHGGHISKDLFGGKATALADDIEYLLKLDFNTDIPAPLPSPYSERIGSVILTDTGNYASIAGGNYQYNTAGGFQDPMINTGVYTRVPGLALLSSVNFTQRAYLGWYNGATNVYTVEPENIGGIYDNGSALSGLRTADGTSYGVAIVLFATGASYWLKMAGTWKIRWVSFFGSMNVFAAAKSISAAGARYIDYFYIRMITALSSNTKILYTYKDVPVSGTEYSVTADALLEMTVTAPAVLDGDANTRCGYYYRTDADLTPAWHCYVDGTGAFRLDSIAADGTRTNRINVAGVIVGGATRTLRTLCDGTFHECWTLAGTSWTRQGGNIIVSLNDTVTRLIPGIPAGWSASNLYVWPMEWGSGNIPSHPFDLGGDIVTDVVEGTV